MGNNKVQAARKSREERLLARQTAPVTVTIPKMKGTKKKPVTKTSAASVDAELLMNINNPRTISEDAAKDIRVNDWVSSEIACFKNKQHGR